MVETRLRLAVVELEEEANTLSAFADGRSCHALRGVWLNEPDGSGHLGYRSSVPFERDDRCHSCAVSALR